MKKDLPKFINKRELREMVLQYARYTVKNHSTEYQDINMLNKIFNTDIKYSEVM